MNNYIGADEVGVGDYFGGIVTCAAFLNEELINKIQDLDIKDSKKLSNKKIIELAKKLIKIVPYEIADISAERYNELFSIYHNAHMIKTFAHNEAIYALQTRMSSFNFITILDQYVSAEKYKEYLGKMNLVKEAKIDEFLTKAESINQAVAVASIIARYYFLKQIVFLTHKYGVVIPLGYNKQFLDKAILLLKEKLGNDFNNQKRKFLKEHFKYN